MTDEPQNFFNNIEPITYNFNLCVELDFNKKNEIEKISIFNSSQKEEEHLISNNFNLSFISSYINQKINNIIENTTTFEITLKNFFLGLQEKYKSLALPPENVKIIMIFDISNKSRVHLKHWTSYPALGGDQDQIIDYFKGILQFSETSLDKEDQIKLKEYVDIISNKILGRG